jgi:hypothetical protein
VNFITVKFAQGACFLKPRKDKEIYPYNQHQMHKNNEVFACFGALKTATTYFDASGILPPRRSA